jgi:hypothetical protein
MKELIARRATRAGQPVATMMGDLFFLGLRVKCLSGESRRGNFTRTLRSKLLIESRDKVSKTAQPLGGPHSDWAVS